MTSTASAPPQIRQDWKLAIGGELVDAVGKKTVATVNPATEEVLAQVPTGDERDVEIAVQAAKKAFASWKKTDVKERANAMRRLADHLRSKMDHYAMLEALDVGSPYTSLKTDVIKGINHLEYFAGIAMESKGETIPASPGRLHYSIREPYGVVGRIIPFNHPLMFAVQKLAAPIIAGNTMVVKPATVTPLTALELAKDITELEILPPGVFNVIVGGGRSVGEAIVRHPDIHRIALIGSTSTGQTILKAAADVGIKHVSLELGGKNAMVVFPDADPKKAAAGSVMGMNFMQNQGQSCGSCSRVFVHRDIHDAFVEEVVRILSGIRQGMPWDPETQMGAVVSDDQYSSVMGYIDSGKSQGATAAFGGGRPNGSSGIGDKGYFIAPTAFVGVKNEMVIAQEEIFGPVVSILSWDNYDQMMAEVNSVDYGLTGAVWTNNLQWAHKAAQDMETGYIWVNESAIHFVGTSFGGYKLSGLGREESVHELLSYTQEKNVHVNLNPDLMTPLP